MFDFQFRNTIKFLSLCLALMVGFYITASHAQDFDFNCALFEGDNLIEQSHCKVTILKSSSGDEEGGNLTNYQWVNGRVIVTDNVEEFYTINGEESQTEFTKDGFDLCVKSLKDNTIFCTGRLSSITKANNLGSYQWAPEALCKANFGYAFQSNAGGGCIENMENCLQDPTSGEECFAPDLCEYWHKDKLVSSGNCVSTGLARANYGVSFWLWENGNEVSILHPIDGPSKWNKVPVQKIKTKRGYNCYLLEKSNEQFCAKSNPIKTTQ